MKLLGDWNWYLPSWLEWLPRFDVADGEAPPETEADPRLRLDRRSPPGPCGPGATAKGAAMTASSTPQPNRRPHASSGSSSLGLAYLKLAHRRRPGFRARRARMAGDLILDPCDYATEDGSYAADCGTLVVPENRADPQSRLIALPVTRIRARSEHPAEPIFRLEGGPGVTNMEFAKASRFADDHDVVLVGYRGVDGSVRLDCPEVESALKHSTDFLGEESFRAFGDGLRACADRLTDDGVDLAGYSLPQRVDDLEAARKALGYGRIDLVSESAGTRTAMIYAWRYPESIHRSVMIAVNPPGHFLWDANDHRRADRPLRRALLAGRRAAARGRTTSRRR